MALIPDSEKKPFANYSYKVKRALTAEERQELADKLSPKLFELARRYLPDFDISNGVPLKPEFLDVVRGGWLLDKREDRPPYSEVVSGIGWLFGLLLEDRFGMQWYFIEDSAGEDVSMLKFQQDPDLAHKEVSILPFNYVAKREEVQNVEVFCDGMLEFGKLMR